MVIQLLSDRLLVVGHEHRFAFVLWNGTEISLRQVNAVEEEEVGGSHQFQNG